MAHARQRARRGDSMTSRQPIGAPRNAPSDAAAERALLFTPAVPRRLVGPHAWSRARVDRLAPRKEPKLSGEGSPFTLHCAPASPFLTPKSWYVGVRGILWPYAGFRPFKFRWGRARAPSTHATETPDPRFPAPRSRQHQREATKAANGEESVARQWCPRPSLGSPAPARQPCESNHRQPPTWAPDRP